MAKEKLNIRFHNPNGDAETVEHIARIFVDASKVKFEALFAAAQTGVLENDTRRFSEPAAKVNK